MKDWGIHVCYVIDHLCSPFIEWGTVISKLCSWLRFGKVGTAPITKLPTLICSYHDPSSPMHLLPSLLRAPTQSSGWHGETYNFPSCFGLWWKVSAPNEEMVITAPHRPAPKSRRGPCTITPIDQGRCYSGKHKFPIVQNNIDLPTMLTKQPSAFFALMNSNLIPWILTIIGFPCAMHNKQAHVIGVHMHLLFLSPCKSYRTPVAGYAVANTRTWRVITTVAVAAMGAIEH